MKWFDIQAKADSAAEITVYGEIGSWELNAKSFIEQVQALGDVSSISLSINSPGGSVFDAIAMFNFLRRMDAAITVRVDGLAASAASLLAMAGDKIIMPANAMMMLHNPWSYAVGNADELREVADALDKVAGAVAMTYQSRTGLSAQKVDELLAQDTWLTAAEALELGLCDEVTEPALMVACCDLARLPDEVSALYQAQALAGDDVTGDEDDSGESAAVIAHAKDDQPEDGDQELAPDVPLTDLPDDAVDVDSVKTEAEEHALAYAQSVVDLCALAGLHERAGAFIQNKISVADVRSELMRIKAQTQVPLATTQTQTSKPWASMTLTERSALYRADPALAAQLKSVKH